MHGMAGATWDQDFDADDTRRLACAEFTGTPPRPDETEAALISNADRCGGSPDHPHGRVGVTGAVEVDINDPQNEQSNKCRGYGFHKLLTVKIRHGFPGRNSHWRYEGTKGGAQDDLPPRSHPLAHRGGVPHGFPITIAIAAARNGSGTETAARNQTNLAGMNGISQRI